MHYTVVIAIVSTDLCVHIAGGHSSTTRQTNLREIVKVDAKRKLDLDLAKGIYYQGNISLGVFEENRHLKRTISDLAVSAGLAGYIPPKR